MRNLTHDPILRTPADLTFSRLAEGVVTELRGNYRIALTGPHRTGKSSMAQAYAQKTGVPYLDANVSGVLRDFGFDSAGSYSDNFGKRLAAQRHLLDHLDHVWDTTEGGLITDRSPLCFAMYTLSEVTGASDVSDDQFAQLSQYLDDCKACTLKHFNLLVLIPLNPAIKPVPAAGKASSNRAYIHHLFTVAQQLVASIGTGSTGVDEMDQWIEAPASAAACEADGAATRRLRELGEMAYGVYAALAEDTGRDLTSAVLPHSALTVNERVEWLSQLTLHKLLNWMQQGVAACKDSPLIEHKRQHLGGLLRGSHI